LDDVNIVHVRGTPASGKTCLSTSEGLPS